MDNNRAGKRGMMERDLDIAKASNVACHCRPDCLDGAGYQCSRN